MAKPEWGTKRTCPGCDARYYDMKRKPAVCPQCGKEYVAKPVPRSRRPAPAAKPVAAIEPTPLTAAAIEAGAEDSDDDKVDEDIDGELLASATADVDTSDDDGGDDTLDTEEKEDEVIEDTSDLGEDNDDLSEALEHVDSETEDK